MGIKCNVSGTVIYVSVVLPVKLATIIRNACSKLHRIRKDGA